MLLISIRFMMDIHVRFYVSSMMNIKLKMEGNYHSFVVDITVVNV